ncbi:MAG: hypothetical protein FJ100_17840 [Deltaproteobacteria bacterium]|nr:hypothetical protein [Deltaproteobacteria bacterium]
MPFPDLGIVPRSYARAERLDAAANAAGVPGPRSRGPVLSTDAPPALQWLSDLYVHVFRRREAEAIDVIYAKFDELLRQSDCADCDEVLANLDVNRLNITATLAVLSITRLDRARLANWRRFAEMAQRKICREAPDRAAALLAGLLPLDS